MELLESAWQTAPFQKIEEKIGALGFKKNISFVSP